MFAMFTFEFQISTHILMETKRLTNKNLFIYKSICVHIIFYVTSKEYPAYYLGYRSGKGKHPV